MITIVEENTNVSWLLSCPCNDGNFKSHLKSASIEELNEVLNNLPEKGNKTKIAVIARELRKIVRGAENE